MQAPSAGLGDNTGASERRCQTAVKGHSPCAGGAAGAGGDLGRLKEGERLAYAAPVLTRLAGDSGPRQFGDSTQSRPCGGLAGASRRGHGRRPPAAGINAGPGRKRKIDDKGPGKRLVGGRPAGPFRGAGAAVSIEGLFVSANAASVEGKARELAGNSA